MNWNQAPTALDVLSQVLQVRWCVMLSCFYVLRFSGVSLPPPPTCCLVEQWTGRQSGTVDDGAIEHIVGQ
ncbi:hypothetical protein SKAU_G00303350 [Synaphobranchus kaupii]|uniref:Uncharacterized protein n=1 Tax=Synaphobranchus kaupii TaxID=118154 RepID=A0A9Q1EW97_SYNKA|nr:hypothetical protein SKAU_G00303350 [Synaphobranchus kaupii]